jgi:hypothetical protein
MISLLALHQSLPLLKVMLDDNPRHVVWVQGTTNIVVELCNQHCSLEPHLGLGRHLKCRILCNCLAVIAAAPAMGTFGGLYRFKKIADKPSLLNSLKSSGTAMPSWASCKRVRSDSPMLFTSSKKRVNTAASKSVLSEIASCALSTVMPCRTEITMCLWMGQH